MTLKALTLGSAVIDIIVTIAPERIEHIRDKFRLTTAQHYVPAIFSFINIVANY